MPLFDRGSIEHRMALNERVRLRSAIASAFVRPTRSRCIYARAVLWRLLVHADRSGRCWPSIGRMARDLECAESTVKAAIGDLVAIGALTRRRRAFGPAGCSGDGRSTVSVLRWVVLDGLARIESADLDDRKCSPASRNAAVERPDNSGKRGRSAAVSGAEYGRTTALDTAVVRTRTLHQRSPFPHDGDAGGTGCARVSPLDALRSLADAERAGRGRAAL